MASTYWVNGDGDFLVDGSGNFYFCEDCPCDDMVIDCPCNSTNLPGLSTVTATVAGIVYTPGGSSGMGDCDDSVEDCYCCLDADLANDDYVLDRSGTTCGWSKQPAHVIDLDCYVAVPFDCEHRDVSFAVVTSMSCSDDTVDPNEWTLVGSITMQYSGEVVADNIVTWSKTLQVDDPTTVWSFGTGDIVTHDDLGSVDCSSATLSVS